MIDPMTRILQEQSVKPAQMLRLKVTGVNPLRVALPGGSEVLGIAVAGLTYSVGQTAYALYQEPAVGPVLPAA